MQLNLDILQRLRSGFLEGTAGRRDYWTGREDLEQYDGTFAQRIGWKWDFVLAELKRLGWQPPMESILDWGCGSGIAHRAFFDAFAPTDSTRLSLWDRSSLAMSFAHEKAQQTFPRLKVSTGPTATVELLLVSHVLTELEPSDLEHLKELAKSATAILWVEPGTSSASRQLVSLREQLRETHGLIAPCPHQGPCGLLAPDAQSHWCHFFASPPPAIFMEKFWSDFSKNLGIDLRSLPVSYLVLDQRSCPAENKPAMRILGRPEVHKPHVDLVACQNEGIREAKVDRRTNPDWYRELKKGHGNSLVALNRFQ